MKKAAVDVIIIAIMALLIASCAMHSSTGSVRDEESILRERGKLFWKAKTTGDWDLAMTFVDPDLRQDLTPYFERLKVEGSDAEYKSIDIRKITIKGKSAIVVVDAAIKWTHPMLISLPVQQRQIKEQWTRKKDTWYVIMRRPDFSKLLEKFGPKEERR